MLTGDASVNADAPIICCTAEVLANIALREGAGADVGQVVMDEFHYYADGQRGWAWQVPLLTLPDAQFLLMSATLGDVSEIADDLSRRTGRETAVIDDAERPVPLTYRWSVQPIHELLEELAAADQAPIYVVHFTQASAMERAQSLLSAKLCTREEREAIAGDDRRVSVHRRLRAHAVQARAGRRRGAPRRDAAALPAPGRAARPDRPAEGDLRHRHARRGHQRPDPDGRLHEPGEVRRHPSPDAEGARVPSDRRPRRTPRVRHVRVRRRAGARPRDRANARAGQGGRRPEEAPQDPDQEAGRRRGELDRGDLRAPARCRTRAARVEDARRPLDDPQRRQPAGGPGRGHARADGGQPRGRARAPAPCPSRRKRSATSWSPPACSWLASPTRTAARCSWRWSCRPTSRSTSRWRRSPWRRSRCSTRRPRATPSTCSRSSRRSSTIRSPC